MFKLGNRSVARLEGVHPILVRVVRRAITISTVDFAVLEGVRTLEKQHELFEAEASLTMNSRHLPKIPRNNPELGPVSHAVDLGAWVGGELRWDWPLYYRIEKAMRAAALAESTVLRWGGDWDSDGDYEDETWRDGPHFELLWSLYPL